MAKAEVCKTSIHRFESDRRLSLDLCDLVIQGFSDLVDVVICRGGGIGRHKGLKIPRTS